MDIKKVMRALEANGYSVRLFAAAMDATDYLANTIRGCSVGFGGSTTLSQMGLHEKLAENNTVFAPDYPQDGETFQSTARKAMDADCYLLSANGLSEDGIIVNLDGYGNRLACSLHGPRKIYYVIGTNKIAENLERTIWRVRNVAAPKNAVRLKLKTPCAVKGDRCYDCSSPQRICNGLLIHLKKIGSAQVEVILIDEALGF